MGGLQSTFKGTAFWQNHNERRFKCDKQYKAQLSKDKDQWIEHAEKTLSNKNLFDHVLSKKHRAEFMPNLAAIKLKGEWSHALDAAKIKYVHSQSKCCEKIISKKALEHVLLSIKTDYAVDALKSKLAKVWTKEQWIRVFKVLKVATVGLL